MSEDVLDVIDDIVGLRRQIADEKKELKLRYAASKPVKTKRFQSLLMMLYGEVKLNFLSANLKEATAVIGEIGDWWGAVPKREKTYNESLAAAEVANPDEKLEILLQVKADCQHELTNGIAHLRELIGNLEMLRQSYKDILAG